MNKSDFPEFDAAYKSALLPDNPDKFDLLAAEANFSVYHSDIWHGTARRFAELIVRDSIIDFYRRYLDMNSNEDITVQVERYIKEQFGVE